MLLERYGRFIVRRRKAVLVAVAIGFLLSVFGFIGLNSRVDHELFSAPGSDSQVGKAFLEREFDAGSPNVVLLVTARHGNVDSPDVAAQARAAVADLTEHPEVANVSSYWSGGSADLRSRDRRQAIAVARIRGDADAGEKVIRVLAPELERRTGSIETVVGGAAWFGAEGLDTAKREGIRAELATGPITLIALLVIFGSVVAALVPLGVAMIAITGTGAGLYLLTFVSPVSAFALYFTTILGLGLSVDYSLFIIGRFREEMEARGDVEEAVVATVRTAGHTILFSSFAVALSLAGIVLIPFEGLRSMAYAGIGTALIVGLSGLILLPAVLATLGDRINALPVRRRSLRPTGGDGRWGRIARTVMRRPLPVAFAVIAVLLVVGTPVLGLNPGLIDDRAYSKDADSRVVGDALRTAFTSREGTPIPIALPGVSASDRPGELAAYAQALAKVDGVVRVESATGVYTAGGREPPDPERAATFDGKAGTWLRVVSGLEPLSDAGGDQIAALRAVRTPLGQPLVTGDAANLRDVTAGIVPALPWVFAFVVVATVLMLMLQFGSVLLPLIAVVLTTISLAATLGAVTFVFQEGRLGDVLGFTATGQLLITTPILISCFAWGLAMDYQVFILSRIKEEYDRTGDAREAIVVGLSRSGPIVSAAAVLITLVFVGTALFSTTIFGKILGFGLGVVVLLDAFVVRGTLVPALMALAGRWSWWAPARLSRLRARLGQSEA